MPKYVEILRLHELSISQRQISQMVKSSRNTVRKVLQIAKENQLSYTDCSHWERERLDEVFSGKKQKAKRRQNHFVLPDYESLSKELAKPGVTMQLLWEEYVDQCRQNKQLYYQLTQFKKYFHDYLSQKKFTHIIHHKAGDRIQVDWGGKKLSWVDPDTGEQLTGYLFVAVLPFSGYAFAVACPNMKQESWIQAHVDCFAFLEGVPTITVPDNLRTGVTKNTRTELILNRSYEDLANHYHTIIVLTRVSRPRDKGAVENTVKNLTTHLIARLRNYQFFSLYEYNQQLRKELAQFNKKPFQKKNGSRKSLFEELEKATLQPLPKHPYEYGEYKTAKVYANSHISYDKHYYSVPYAYIGKTITLKIFSHSLKLFDGTTFLYEHSTQYKQPGQYTTDQKHLPENSATFGKWNSSRYIQWAKRIGPNVEIVVEKLFDQGPEQQYYRRVHSLLKLADTSSDQRLDHACHYALEKTSVPSYQMIKKILEQQDTHSFLPKSITSKDKEQSYLRGADYYDNQGF